MNKILWNTLKQSPGIVGAALVLTNAALATETSSVRLDSSLNLGTGAIHSVEWQTENSELLAQGNSDSGVESVEYHGSELENQVAGEAPVIENGEAPAQTTELELAQVETADPADSSEVGISDLEQMELYTEETDVMDQVTSVSQLSDVQPTDWAFQALQSLVERYGCIAGYPDGTYKGNRAMTRYEFAAGLNACLERVNELIAASTANLVSREDLAVLQRLQEEFAAELAALRGRVLALEARTAELEANQFSTTTKLRGEVIFFIGDTFGDRSEYTVAGGPNVEDSDDPTQSYFGYRARLNFDTSFTGEDLLRTRLEAKDVPNLSRENLTNTLMSRLGTDGGEGDFILDDLYYRFPVFNGRGQVYFGAKSLDLDDVQDPLSPFQSTGAGAASRFGRYNPTTFRGPEGTGLAMKYQLNDRIRLNFGYLASQDDAPDPSEGRGLFDGSHSAFFQVVYEPLDNLAIALDYNRRYFRENDVSASGGTGSFLANRPFGDNPTTTDNLGFQANWRIAERFELGGWLGVTWADDKPVGEGDDLDATLLNFAVTLAFPDLFREGSLGGIIVGMQPKVVYHTLDNLEEDKTGIHIEAFYRYQVNDYIALVPGVYILTDPEHTDENDTIVVTTFRTQFRF
ncbi:MAG: iron uptake porin [Lyngbya sp.]|nr:iron uptake porin [Lyngbya sp.]